LRQFFFKKKSKIKKSCFQIRLENLTNSVSVPHHVQIITHLTRGGGGGREGSNAPPHLPKISPTLRIFFLSKVLVAHPKKLIKEQIFFKKIEFHESHRLLPYFHWFFNLKPVTLAAVNFGKICSLYSCHVYFFN
jgi:hypothetical protein